MIVRFGIVFVAGLCWTTSLPPVFAQSVVDPDSLFMRALRLQHQGELRAAEAGFRILLNSYPDYHDARVQYGRILAWDGRYREADAQFDSVLFLVPTHIEARFAKGQALAWSGRYRQSASVLLALLEETPQSARILNELGNVYARGGAPRTALEYYEKAYVQAPSDPSILRGVARTHRTLGNESLALYWYQKLLAEEPGDAEARSEIQRLLYRSNHELRFSASYETFGDSAVSEHVILQAEYSLAVHEDWKPFVHISRVSKFGSREYRLGAGAYGTVGRSLGLFVQALASPDARVTPDFDGTIEVNGGILSSVELIGGYRYMRYDSLNVNVLAPGVVWYVADDAWLILRGYAGWVPRLPASSAGTATLVLRAGPSTTLRVGGFAGNEVFQATSVREISDLKSSGAFAGLKARMNRVLALEGVYQYTSRSLYGDSHLFMLTVSTLF